MSIETTNVIIGVLIGFLSSIITTFINNQMQVKREKILRWWDRKEEAYRDIIESLYQLTNYYEIIIAVNTGETSQTENERKEMSAKIIRYFGNIKKEATIGAFFVSENAENSLKKFLDTLKTTYDSSEWMIEMEEALTASRKCLKEITSYAKKDLGIQR